MADMGGMPDMAGMAMAPGWTPATAVLTLAMWVVMMTGMMLPSAAPMILTFAALHRREAAAERWVTTLLFVAGYLAVWAGFSLAATLLQWRSEEHTSELQSLMRISYAVFCLKQKTETISIHKSH